MTTSNRVIVLSDYFNSASLVTRQAARDIFELIANAPENQIVLDFRDISNATRSFFDELHAHWKKCTLLGKLVDMVNLNEDLMTLYRMVSGQSGSSSASVGYASTANAKYITI